MKTITEIEELTRAYGRERAVLAERVQSLEDDLLSTKRRRMPGIKSALAKAQDSRDKLASAIESAPELFVKPRTITVDGIRVGLMKSKGKIQWDSPERVVKLIRKHLPEQADALIVVKESPGKAALGNLTTAQLKQIGCTVTETGEVVSIKPQDSEIDKMVDRLLESDTDTEVES